MRNQQQQSGGNVSVFESGVDRMGGTRLNNSSIYLYLFISSQRKKNPAPMKRLEMYTVNP